MKYIIIDEWGQFDEAEWDKLDKIMKVRKQKEEKPGSLSLEVLQEAYDSLKAYDGTDEGCGDMVLDKLNEMEESKEKEPIIFELKPRASFFDIFK